jgi:hypothetical protein
MSAGTHSRCQHLAVADYFNHLAIHTKTSMCSWQRMFCLSYIILHDVLCCCLQHDFGPLTQMSDSSFLGAGAAAGCTGTGFVARRGCTKPYHNMPPETGGDRIMLLRLTADC